MIGKTLSHFRIVEKIGEGGMGVVYRARDESLDREVALKVLPAGSLADEAARRRFRKEALALSRLNHPNIETVHAFDIQDGVDFLVMEFIPGVTLDEKLASGPLPEKEVARLGAQLADGLAAAHRQGVVHRDLKPGNLRLTPDGRLKILDFGLAKWLQVAGSLKTTEKPTETGGAGTLPYMAPEQLRAEGIDPRSDIYAAGAVLYEMATGQKPFPQTSPPQLIEAILNQAPPYPSAVNPQISLALENIVVKALEKDPERRYQTARELFVDLERLREPSSPAARWGPRRLSWRAAVILAAGAIVTSMVLSLAFNLSGLRKAIMRGIAHEGIESIAVLPLANLTGDPEQEYLADGITEDLTTSLAQIRSLRVISRTSAMRHKGTRKPLPEIARELKVEAVVEGALRRSGQRVHVTAQLIEAATDRHLWARSYERDPRDILILEADLAQQIAQEIKVAITPQERARLAIARPVDPEAHEDFLKGRYFVDKFSGEGAKRALTYFERAIEADPDYALAYVGLSIAYGRLAVVEVLPPIEAYSKARAPALKALDLDDTLAEAHYAIAKIKAEFDWDWAGAEAELKRALELNPGYWAAHNQLAEWLESMGRLDEALAERKRARELDPLSLAANLGLGGEYYSARQYDQAIEQLRQTLDLYPDSARPRPVLAYCYVEKGMFQEAIAEAQKALSLSEGSTEYRAGLGYVLARAGMRDKAREVLAELHELSKRSFVSPAGMSFIHAALGEKDQAFASLEEGYEKRDGWLPWLKSDPRFDPLRSDPRFRDLLRQVGLPIN